jgi:hypothetical protein
MPDKLQQPAFSLRIFRPSEHDRRQIERTRALIKYTRQILAESDSAFLAGARRAETSSSENENE